MQSEIKNAVAGTTAAFNITGNSKRNVTSQFTMPDPGIFKKAQETETTTIQLRPYQEGAFKAFSIIIAKALTDC
jgi:hypothetical protein